MTNDELQAEPVGAVAMDVSGVYLLYGDKFLGRKPDRKTVILFNADLPVGTLLYTTPKPQAAEQAEPFAEFRLDDGCGHVDLLHVTSPVTVYDKMPLYTTPQPRKPLNLEQIRNGAEAHGVKLHDELGAHFHLGVRYAEQRHGIGGINE